VELTSPWTSDEVSASGQVFEFRLWALLTEQSRGQLHVFLPLTDRGIDALLHRRTDDRWISLQAKSRSTLIDGEVHIVVWENSLQDPNALLVSGLITDGGVGPTMLVIREGDFTRLAERSHHKGRPVLAARFGMHPRARSRFYEFLTPTDRLVERFGISLTEALAPPPQLPPMWRSDLGALGEVEVARLLTEGGELNVFRPFPDLETAELAALRLTTRRVVGIQVKTIGIDTTHPAGTVTIHASSFRPSPTTYLVALAWLRDGKRFHDESLLIPTVNVPEICRPHESGNHISFDWHPGSGAHSNLSRYRQSRNHLMQAVAAFAS